jgi:hypothetical protein
MQYQQSIVVDMIHKVVVVRVYKNEGLSTNLDFDDITYRWISPVPNCG